MSKKKYIIAGLTIVGSILAFVGGCIHTKNNSIRVSLTFGPDDKDDEKRFLDIYKCNSERFRNMRIDVRDTYGFDRNKTRYSFNIDKYYLWLLNDFVVDF